MKTIVVPTDYSENAWCAAEYGAHLAQRTGARLVLFHAVEMPLVTDEITATLPPLDALNQRHLQRLDEMAVQMSHRFDIRVEHRLRVGHPSVALNQVFREENADLVVLGLRGTNPIGRLLMGSLTATLLRKAELPVLVVPRDFAFHGIRHILFACDFRPLAQTNASNPLAPLRAIAKSFKATVEVMHLPQPLAAGYEEEAPVRESYWDEQLQGLQLGYTFLYEDNLEHGIDQGVCDSHADLLVMIPHRHTFFQRLLDKSNVQKMAFHTRIPLLALPGDSGES
ncbi:MAG: universal stress protein [Cytophagales bacterium]|jgi:nucleotide-binding universal stress UspA family protein|nr:universal stress protein [Cytophagales bacterium]